MRSFLLFSFLLLAAGRLSAQAAYFTVKFPDDRTVQGCGLPTVTDWPEISQTPYCSFGVGVSVKDQIFYTNGTSCGKIMRRYRLLYWCDYDPNWPSPYIIANPPNTDLGPTVTATPQNHGYLEYTQVIKFTDNGAPKFLNCPASGTTVTFCDYSRNDPAQYNTNHIDRCEGVVDLTARVTDGCSKTNLMLSYRLWLDLDGNGTAETFRTSSDSLGWPIELTKTADTLTGRIKFPAGFALPYGQHMVEWIVMDNCGNQSVCKYPFVVKDCAPPTIFCYNGLSVNIMETGMITLWASDFVQKKFDNCSPEQQIKLGVRKKGTGTGFPQNSTGVLFDCNELGPQDVEIWVADAYGNASHCDTYVDVQDPMDICSVPKGAANDRRSTGSFSAKTTFRPPVPNPAADWLQVTVPSDVGEGVIEIRDLNGVLMAERAWHAPGEVFELATTHWKSGVYLVYFRTPEAVSTARVVVSN